MSILNDKTFEAMDWISQAVEPYHCEINDILARMPDEYIVEVADVLNSVGKRYSQSLDRDTVVNELYAKLGEVSKLSYDEMDILSNCFTLATNGHIVVDAEEATMSGEIKLIKVANLVEDKVVKRLISRASHLRVNYKEAIKEAINDLGTLFLDGTDSMKQFNEMTPKNKFYHISNHIVSATEKDTFKFRSVKACRDFVRLVGEYLTTNNAKMLGEIYRVVVMSKRGQVIYSVGV